MEKGCKPEQLEKFLQQVAKLNAVEFIGLCRILVVEIADEEGEPRDFESMLSDCIDRFVASNRKIRREVLKTLKSINLEKI